MSPLLTYCISWIIVKTGASNKNYLFLGDIKAPSLGRKEHRRSEKCLQSEKQLLRSKLTSAFHPVRFHLVCASPDSWETEQGDDIRFFFVFTNFALLCSMILKDQWKNKALCLFRKFDDFSLFFRIGDIID